MSVTYPETELEWFLRTVNKLPNGCWQWTKSLVDNGYGYYTYKGMTQKAHRFSYKMFVGEIPEGKQIDHLCRNRGCVNPNHLEAVTRKENILRGEGYAAKNARKTHCSRGHEFTKENTWHERGGAKRVCKTCRKMKYKYIGNEYHRAYRAKKKALGVFAARIEKGDK